MTHRFWIGLAFLPVMQVALAHDDPAYVLKELDKAIQHQPTDPALYQRRSTIHRGNQQWALAEADLRRAVEFNAKINLDLELGQLYLMSGKPKLALLHLDRYLLGHTDVPRAYSMRAYAKTSVGKHRQAVDDFNQAIKLDQHASYELFIDRANAWVDADIQNTKSAIKQLDEAMGRFGQSILLREHVIHLCLRAKLWSQAIFRIDELLPLLKRQEQWLVQKALILERKGNPAAAQANMLLAQQAIQQLPLARQNVPAMQSLKKTIAQHLKK